MTAASPARRRRRFLVPEVVQSSAMDCGPAALKSLLEGFRIGVSYGRLREACHTDIDGTSIDTLETLSGELGLKAEQVLVPLDHALRPEARNLPAIGVINSPMGGAHFVVIWRRIGSWVQVMDPARGRAWLREETLLDRLYLHSTVVAAAEWREWASTPGFLIPLDARMRAVGVSRRQRADLLVVAQSDRSCRTLAALDAAVRLVDHLVEHGALTRRQTAGTLETLVAGSCADPTACLIPDGFWSARPVCGQSDAVRVTGAVLVRVIDNPEVPADRAQQPQSAALTSSPEIQAALRETPARPLMEAFRLLRADGLLVWGVLGAATAIAVAAVVLEALILRSVLDVGLYLRTVEQGVAAGVAIGAFALIMLGLEFAVGSAEQRAGRRLEGRLRLAFLGKIARLPDAYFQSRPVSDMAERGHAIHVLRVLPALAARMLRITLELGVTTAAIAWLAPDLAPLAIVAAALSVLIPAWGQLTLADRDLRARTHAAALGRFHLDALLGRKAIEAHGAAGAVEREHESLLQEWVRASLALQRGSVAVEGVQLAAGFALMGWMVLGYAGAAPSGAALLLVYWMLNLPALGYELSMYARAYPAHRSTLLRLLEPLSAPESEPPAVARTPGPTRTSIGIEARNVSAKAGGHEILSGVRLVIGPGAHVAIVGPSGAGKSTLLGLLLGWHRPAGGELLVDNVPITEYDIDELRAATAWVDPSVRLWNASLLDNLRYGSDPHVPLAPVLEAAGLLPVIAKLPDGLATPIGENGALLSAGEAQRVRLGRAMLRSAARLVLLDEPFMGLERDRRRALLAEARQRWASSTLLYVTHEVGEARAFDRVLVIEHGTIVEDGDPRQLAQTASSRYRRLVQAHEAVHARLGASSEWRRIRVLEGRIVQDSGKAGYEQTA